MDRWPQMGITRKFFLFFFITAIFPIIVFSGVFLQFIDTKFDERIDSVLRSSKILAQDILQGQLEKLHLSSRQIASVSLFEVYQNYMATGNRSDLLEVLQRYQQSRNLVFIRLVDAQGKAIFTLQNPTCSKIPALDNYTHAALAGHSLGSVDLFYNQNSQPGMIYMAASPILTDRLSGQAVGAIIIGEPIDFGQSFHSISRILPDYFLRVYVKLPHEYSLIYANIPIMSHIESNGLLQRFHKAEGLPHYTPETILGIQPLYEVVNHNAYKSRVLMLQNFMGKPIGFLVLGTPSDDYQALRLGNVISVILCILMALIMVSLAGWWFTRTIVNPIQNLAEASKAVGEGNLDVRVPGLLSEGEISNTLDNFNEMLDRLQENDQLRQTFVSTLAHDLRTPLIAEAKILEVIEEDLVAKNEPGLTDMIRSMNRSNNRLLEMVNKLLEAYQYEAGQIRLVMQPFSLQELITECFDDTRVLADNKKIKLETDIPKSLPDMKGDVQYLKRVFVNLISNAVENIPKGGRVEIVAQEEPESIVISVQDNGTGINSEDLPFLFERYYTGNKIKRKIGSGLGLFICKMIVELHDGTIDAENIEDQGSRFIIRMPKPIEKDEAGHFEREIIRNL